MNIGKFSYFRGGIKNKNKSIDITLRDAIQKIKNPPDKVKADILKLREIGYSDKSLRKVLKDSLDYFTFSGLFKERNAQQIQAHSNLLVIDFDLNGLHKVKQPDNTVAEVMITEYNIPAIKERLGLDKYSLVVFISPSGDGIKVLVRIDGAGHLAAFKFLEKYYLDTYGLEVDPSGKDVSRACYISYDPDPILNENAEIVIVSATPATPAVEALPQAPEGMQPDLDFDPDTGEVYDRNAEDMKKWSAEKRTHFERCKAVASRIFEKKIDITSSYEDWQNIAFSLAIFGEAGRSLFHKISSQYNGYDEKQTDTKFSDAIKNGRSFTNPAKLFSICKAYNIDTKITKTIQGAAAEGAEGRAYQDWKYELPDGMELTPEVRRDTLNYNFIEYNNQYWYAKFDNNNQKVGYYPISNFVIEPLFLIMSRSEPKRIVEIRNMFGRSRVLDIMTEAFVSPQQLYAAFEAQGNFLFDGNRSQLQKIKSKIYDKTAEAVELSTLGFHKDGFYAFCNGIYTHDGFKASDDFGVVSHADNNYFIAPGSTIYRDEEGEFENQKKFVFIKGKTTLKEWAQLFIDVHEDNGRIGLAFFFTSLFRDIVYSYFKFYPLLFGFGPPGTGKSAMAWSLTSMFGEPLTPFNLNGGTKVAFHKTFAMFKNAIVWFDEYSNSIDPSRSQAIKASYDGAGHQKSEMNGGNRTKTTPVYSAAVITGQELPNADNAVFKRVILNEYHKTDHSDEERVRLESLREMEKKGLSHITAHLSTLRPLFEEHYFKNFDTVVRHVKDLLGDNMTKVESRIVQNYSIILAGYKTVYDHLPFDLPFSYTDLARIVAERILTQNALISNSKETSTFWTSVAYMAAKHMISEEKDYRIEARYREQLNYDDGESYTREFGQTKNVLYLNITSIHPQYMKIHREQYNRVGMDRSSLIHYLKHEGYYIGSKKAVRFGEIVTNAFVFDYDALDKIGVSLLKKPISKEEEAEEKSNSSENPNPSSGDTGTLPVPF